MNKNIVYVTSLARPVRLYFVVAGAAPVIYSTAHSSPLCHALSNLRRQMSDDPFLLSQLDDDFDRVYGRLTNAFRGFVEGWFAETDKQWVVDKNRGWLGEVETEISI
jgi:sulfotransferase